MFAESRLVKSVDDKISRNENSLRNQIMSEETEEFNERFETVEQTLKYIADAQAKSEFLHKKFQVESRKRWEQTQKQLDYITKLTGIAFEDLQFQEEKLQSAGENLRRKKV